MRALTGILLGALVVAGCETAFVGRAPGGRYALAEVNGQAPPHVANPGHHCPVRIDGGHFELDSLARRFEMVLDRASPCAAPADTVERGSYLRRGGRLELEAAPPGGSARTLFASESGDSIALNYDGLRLRFRQVTPQR
jgi:hypothetical protein